jgi:hypothetical protein
MLALPIVPRQTCALLRLKIDCTILTVLTIDLVLKDQQSVGKRNLHLMDTVNKKKRWTTIYVSTIFEREPRSGAPANDRASFLKINDLNDIYFFGMYDCSQYCSIV